MCPARAARPRLISAISSSNASAWDPQRAGVRATPADAVEELSTEIGFEGGDAFTNRGLCDGRCFRAVRENESESAKGAEVFDIHG